MGILSGIFKARDKPKPLGFLAKIGGADVGVTAASATAITADEIIDLFYSLKTPCRKNAVWILNEATVKAVRKLKDSTGQYLWQSALTEGTPDKLLGRPVYTSAYYMYLTVCVNQGTFNFELAVPAEEGGDG